MIDPTPDLTPIATAKSSGTRAHAAAPASLLQSQLIRYNGLIKSNGPLSVLVADDEKRLLDLISICVQSMGHKVVRRCSSGPEAVKEATALMPDLVILDVNMPGGDGIEAANIIAETLAIPAIVGTALTDSSTMARVTSSSIKGYLVKPFSPAQLKSAICVAIAQHRNDLAARCQLLASAA
jgi:CheY-like chemotaxis protein